MLSFAFLTFCFSGLGKYNPNQGASSAAACQNCAAGSYGGTQGLTTSTCTGQICCCLLVGNCLRIVGFCTAGYWCSAGSSTPTQNPCACCRCGWSSNHLRRSKGRLLSSAVVSTYQLQHRHIQQRQTRRFIFGVQSLQRWLLWQPNGPDKRNLFSHLPERCGSLPCARFHVVFCGFSGSYCIAHSTSPAPCPAGTYNANLGGNSSASCINCQPGSYGTSGSQSTATCTNTCTAGNYCPAGSTSPTPCPAGLLFVLG